MLAQLDQGGMGLPTGAGVELSSLVPTQES
jgi:hypothetical protein